MKTMKRFAAFLAAASMICAALTCASAADAFKVEEGSLPAAVEGFANTGGILAQDDGSLDAFSRNGKTLYHHRSTDGGKTWKKQDDTAWFAAYAKKYEIPKTESHRAQSFTPDGFVTDGKGTFYFTASTRRVQIKKEQGEWNFVATGLFRLQNGQAALVKEYDQRPETPSILDYSADSLALCSSVRGDGSYNKYRFTLVNPTDGAVKYEHEFDGMIPAAYADGKVSGWNQYTIVEEEGKQPEKVGREVDKRLWIVFDTATGKEIQKVVNPLDHMDKAFEEDFELFFHAAGPDGTYFAGVEGLYRLKPGAQSFEKLLDGGTAGLAGVRQCGGFYTGKKGDFYALTSYWNRTNFEDAQNGTQTKLLHYIPA